MLGAWHTQEIGEIFRVFKSGEKGLAGTEAARRLRESGPNVLPEVKPGVFLLGIWMVSPV